MHNGVIDAGSAGRCAFQDIVSVLAEVVECQRLGTVYNEFYCLICGFDGDNGEYRSEYLFLHHGRRRLHVVKQCRGEVAFVSICLTSENDSATVKIALEPIKRPVIDNPHKVSTFLRVLTEE